MSIKIFADCADYNEMQEIEQRFAVAGFTTNPTLMQKAGVVDFVRFAKAALNAFPQHPISFEVVAGDTNTMFQQALTIQRWGANAYVKIPVTTPTGDSCMGLIHGLGMSGVPLNVTAIMTLDQVFEAARSLPGHCPSIISVFAGRIADTGVDPVPIMKAARAIVSAVNPKTQLLWASPREVLNFYQAEDAGCDIITMPRDLLAKMALKGRDLAAYSLETVQMFDRDAKAARFTI